MQIFVKAANTFSHPYYMARREDHLLKIISPKSLLMPNIIWPPVGGLKGNPRQEIDPLWLKIRQDDYVVEECKIEDNEILSYFPSRNDFHLEIVRRSVPLTVESTLTIGALKSMLKPHPWIPKTNLVLVQHEKFPMEDDRSTLAECGIKDQDTLLACMAGSFLIQVYYRNHMQKYVIPISSCFETVGDVKDKITQLTGSPRKDQTLSFGLTRLDDKDETRLVTLGIVRPYLDEMFLSTYLVLTNFELLKGKGHFC